MGAFRRFSAACGHARVLVSFVFALTDIAIPEVKFEEFPATPLPITALLATAVGGGFQYTDFVSGAAAKACQDNEKE